MPTTVPPRHRIVEANHRIANQLGQLAALLKTQIDATARGPQSLSRQSVVDTLRVHFGQLLGISRLHHAIGREPDQDDVDLAAVLTNLLREFEASRVFEDRLNVTSTFAARCRVDASQASAVTLAFSEIVSNAMKYAHPTGLPVEMIVTATTAADGTVALSIADDGVGLPENFVESRDVGVGLNLVRSLMESIGGRLTMSWNALGLRFDIELPRRRDGVSNGDALPIKAEASRVQRPWRDA